MNNASAKYRRDRDTVRPHLRGVNDERIVGQEKSVGGVTFSFVYKLTPAVANIHLSIFFLKCKFKFFFTHIGKLGQIIWLQKSPTKSTNSLQIFHSSAQHVQLQMSLNRLDWVQFQPNPNFWADNLQFSKNKQILSRKQFDLL